MDDESLINNFTLTPIIPDPNYSANVIALRGVLKDGVNFIQKPFSTEDLAVKVRDVLDRSKT